ncbi:hypothetical protein [Legionella cardiaca]|uniref:Uncharacterized protein n=1 Tax=Legionella cardiaca TaxID=1071983 RepID=A0ABY8AQI9_9GAMM|nr:hypothetical protein [Legionella cardiaca]WED42491.1 hypothetical protein PXX05_11270 [Legionella cardiaca]
MKAKLETLCTITWEEFTHLVYGIWPRERHAEVTTIPYTFDINSAPEVLTNSLKTDYKKMTMQALAVTEQQTVVESLNNWVSACANLIEFKYKSKLGVDEPGIIFIGCEQMEQVNGVTQSIRDAQNYFKQVLICLPSTIKTAVNKRTVHHEIGHGLGLNHTHNVESVNKLIKTIPEGLGCSVMGYNFLLQTAENHCFTEKYCLNETFAVIPGPMDSQVCATLYQFPEFSMERYFTSMFLGFLNGSTEQALSSFLMNVKFLNISENAAANYSMLASTLTSAYLNDTGSSVVNSLALIEFTSRLYSNSGVEYIHVIKTLTSIASLFMTLYESYGDEAALIRGIYLAAFLISTFAGVSMGTFLGKEAAGITNGLTNKLGSLFNWGTQQLTSRLPTFSNWLFGKKETIKEELPEARIEGVAEEEFQEEKEPSNEKLLLA